MTSVTEEMIEALKPFAEFIGDDTRVPDDMPLTAGSSMAKKQVLARDFRRARAALEAALSAARHAEAKAGMVALGWFVRHDPGCEWKFVSGDPERSPNISSWERRRAFSALEPVAEAKAEPVAWQGVMRDGEVRLTRVQSEAEGWREAWAIVRPLFASPTPPALTDRAVSPVAQQRDEVIEAERDKWLEAHRKTARHGYSPERKDQSNG